MMPSLRKRKPGRMSARNTTPHNALTSVDRGRRGRRPMAPPPQTKNANPGRGRPDATEEEKQAFEAIKAERIAVARIRRLCRALSARTWHGAASRLLEATDELRCRTIGTASTPNLWDAVPTGADAPEITTSAPTATAGECAHWQCRNGPLHPGRVESHHKIGCGVKKDCDFGATLNTHAAWAASTTVWVCQCVHTPANARAPLSPHHSRAPCLRRYQQAGNWAMAGEYETNVLDPSTCPSFDAASSCTDSP